MVIAVLVRAESRCISWSRLSTQFGLPLGIGLGFSLLLLVLLTLLVLGLLFRVRKLLGLAVGFGLFLGLLLFIGLALLLDALIGGSLLVRQSRSCWRSSSWRFWSSACCLA